MNIPYCYLIKVCFEAICNLNLICFSLFNLEISTLTLLECLKALLKLTFWNAATILRSITYSKEFYSVPLSHGTWCVLQSVEAVRLLQSLWPHGCGQLLPYGCPALQVRTKFTIKSVAKFFVGEIREVLAIFYIPRNLQINLRNFV